MTDKKVLTTLRLDASLRKKIKIRAAEEEKKYNTWIIEAILAKLKKEVKNHE